MMKKVVDGKVAVLVSPGYGAGWYSWNLDHPELIFDPVIVDMVLENRLKQDVGTYLETKYGEGHEIYTGGLQDLVVRWVDEGKRFRINEYDGSESLVLEENEDWFVA